MRPVQAAESAAEGLRQLCHLMLTPGGYVWPSDVDDVIAGLVSLVDRLPQALDQAARWVEAEHREGRVAHDSGDDVSAPVGDLIGDLDTAAREARELARTLSFASLTSAHLTGLRP